MKVFPCAKINLGLNIVSKRLDGYHNLETVFYPVGIYDELEVEPLSSSDAKAYELIVNGVDDICAPCDNLVIKAYNLLAQHYTMPPVRVVLTKNIPSQAGMGGGSSDAAYMIRLLNELFSLGLTIQEMKAYAAKLGADCAFFIDAQPAYATGIGDILESIEIDGLKNKYLALIKPNVAVSTKEAYSDITPHAPRVNCREILSKPVGVWKDNLLNDFEDSVFRKLPVLADVKSQLYAKGALYAAMSGSGSTVFGIFNEAPIFVKDIFSEYYNKVIEL